jgi:hypothetical protein
MKKNIFKLVFIALVLVFGFNSCDQTVERAYFDGQAPGYSFYHASETTEFTSDGNIYSVTIARANASQAATVPLTFSTSAPTIFSSVSSASFEAGQSEVKIPVNYDFSKMTPGTSYNFKFTIADADKSFGAAPVITVTGSMKITWVKVGSGLFYSEWFDEEWDTDLYMAEGAAGLYKLPDCYYNGYDIIFTLNADNSITYATQQFGYNHSSYGMASWRMPRAQYQDYGEPRKEGNVFLFLPEITVSAGTFGQAWEEFELK